MVFPELTDPETRDTQPAPYFLGNGQWGFSFTREELFDADVRWQNIFRSEYDHSQRHTFIDPLTQTLQLDESSSDWWPDVLEDSSPPDNPEVDGEAPDPGPQGGDDGENGDDPCERFNNAEARRICNEIIDRRSGGGTAGNPNSPPDFSSPQSPGTSLLPIDKNSLKDSGLLPKTDDSLLKSKVKILKSAKYHRKGKKRDYVKVRVRCYALPGKRCKGTLRLYSSKRYKVKKGKKRRLLVGLKKFSITPKLIKKGMNGSESETEYLSPKKSKTKTKHTSEKVVNKPRTITVRLRAVSSKKLSVSARRITSKVIKRTVRALRKQKKSKRLKATATVTSKDIVGAKIKTKASKTLKVKRAKKKSRKSRKKK